MKFRKDNQSNPIPVLLDKALRDRIEAVALRMGEPKSTVMRIAMRIGLEGLDKVFEQSPAIAAVSKRYPEHQPENLALNEEPSSPRTKGPFETAIDEASPKAPKSKRTASQKSKK